MKKRRISAMLKSMAVTLLVVLFATFFIFVGAGLVYAPPIEVPCEASCEVSNSAACDQCAESSCEVCGQEACAQCSQIACEQCGSYAIEACQRRVCGACLDICIIGKEFSPEKCNDICKNSCRDILQEAILELVRDKGYMAREFRGEKGREHAKRLAKEFRVASELSGEDPILLASVARNESNFRQSTVGGVGEVGVMQLHPKYIREFGCDPTRAKISRAYNIACGAMVLSENRERCSRNDELASDAITLAAYNGGSCKPGKKARAYARRVLAHMSRVMKELVI
jgi:hypothetical protein